VTRHVQAKRQLQMGEWGLKIRNGKLVLRQQKKADQQTHALKDPEMNFFGMIRERRRGMRR